MAGITFKLEKYIGKASLSEAVLQEFVHAIESTGSWWLTISFLIFIGWITGLATKAFKVYIVLTFATVLSMFFSSFLNPTLSKYLSDKLFLRHYKDVCDNLCGAVIAGTLSSFSFSLVLALFFSNLPLNQKIIFSSLTSALTGVWITNNVMSILEEEKSAFFSFVIAFLLTFLFVIILGRNKLNVFLTGITIGFASVFFSQLAFILKGYNRGEIIPCLSFLRIKEYFYETFSFMFFILGIWIDKVVFWFMPSTACKIDSLFRYSKYDFPFFVSFTIFSFSQFLIFRSLKDAIRKPYENFINSVRYNLPLFRISQEKYNIISGYRKIFYSIIYIYGGITTIVLFAISAGIIDLPWKNPFVFHYLTMGTFFLAIFSFNYMMLQYLDQYRAVAQICFIFTLINGIGTYIGIKVGSEYNGLAFLFASFISACLSMGLVNKVLGRWEYEIFKESSKVF